ncbi:MAG: T9SS type A sorting domain-containing protein [Phaeodactylibacter sp.]|nr:T9SS type A sorting domain-containing protein [Phaeodactylibacter sp.]MCB9276785.1 T9SS type A sorting domain-containing protein [Lewinellaceae bacterium]
MKKALQLALLLSALACLLPITTASAGISPAVLNGIAVGLPPSGQATVPASCFLAGNQCALDEVRISRASAGPLGDTPPPDAAPTLDVGCDDLGIVIVHIWGHNALGEWSAWETFLMVQDNFDACDGGASPIDAPVLEVIVGLSYSPSGQSSDWQVHASDFVAAYALPNGGSAWFSFSPDPADSTFTLSCSNAGQTISRRIYIHDSEGSLPAFTETYLTLFDPYGLCNTGSGGQSFPTYNGLVYTLPAEQQIVLSASDFAPCCDGRAYAFSADPADSLMMVGCDELDGGLLQMAIDVFGFEPDGSYSAATTYVILQDLQERCGQGAFTPPNDDVCNAIAIPVASAHCPLLGTNAGATAQPGEPSPPAGDCTAVDAWCDGQPAEQSVWYSFEAPSSGSVAIRAGYFNTQLAVWEADNCQDITAGGAILAAANDDSSDNGIGEAALSLSCLIPGKAYYIQVDGYAGAAGAFSLTVEDAGLSCLIAGSSPECTSQGSASEASGHQGWRHIYGQELGLVASIAEMGNPLGAIEAAYQTNEGGIRTDGAGQPYLDRNWAISAEQQPAAGPVRLRLYFSEAEFLALQSAAGDIESPASLFLTRVPEGSCGPYAEGGELYEQRASGPFNEQGYYADFEIPGFSSFYLNGSAGLVSGAGPEAVAAPFRLFPNPTGASAWVEVVLNNGGPVQARVFNLQGVVVAQQQYWAPAGKSRLQLPLDGLPPGWYSVDVKTGAQAWKTSLLRLP